MSTKPHPAAHAAIILVTGISGSGKSVALHALEDAGCFCVDNLPPELLRAFLTVELGRAQPRPVAIGMDVRSISSVPTLLAELQSLRREGVSVRPLFLDAQTDTLVRRFSETRRPHPLSQAFAQGLASGQGLGEASHGAQAQAHALIDAIELERQRLADLREISTVIDTSPLRPAQLRAWVRELVQAPSNRLTLVFESFAFKHGVPLDADFVFDVRMLPNPHYLRELRPLTGRDAPVAAYLDAQPEVLEMLEHIDGFIQRWLPSFEHDHRSYLTVAVGCTGGQHRSVYLTERLAARHQARGATLVRHRELDARLDSRMDARLDSSLDAPLAPSPSP